jgi:hypothetical protein
MPCEEFFPPLIYFLPGSRSAWANTEARATFPILPCFHLIRRSRHAQKHKGHTILIGYAVLLISFVVTMLIAIVADALDHRDTQGHSCSAKPTNTKFGSTRIFGGVRGRRRVPFG